MAELSTTTTEERLDRLRGQLSGRRSVRAADRRMRLGRAQNLFVGVTLHAAARRDQGMELTGLEELLLGAAGRVLGEEEIAGFGRVYQEETSTAAAELFPEMMVGRPLSKGYASEDLIADLPRLEEEIAAQPNASIVRVDELAPDAPLDSKEFSQALAEHGGGITVVLGPAGTGRGVDGADAASVKLSLKDFRCLRASGEAGRDEIYWTSSAGSDSADKREYQSGEFGAIEQGNHRAFPADTYMFDGRVDQWLTCTITCWEADGSPGSWYDKLRQGLRDISDYCFKTSEALEDQSGEYEGGSAWLSLVGLVAALFNWLLGLVINDDDLVKERSIGFSRSALQSLSQRPGGVDEWDFNGGGGGHHKLNIRAQVSNPRVDTTIRYTVLTGSSWSTDAPLPATGGTLGAPALASFNGKLYTMHRDASTAISGALWWNSFDGSSWTAFQKLGGGAETPSAPAMAVYNGKLYSMHRAAGGDLHWNTLNTNGTSWSGFTMFPSGKSSATPALAAFDGILYCVFRGAGSDSLLYYASYNGTSWSAKRPLLAPQWTTPSAPALAAHGNRVHCVWRTHEGGLQLAHYSKQYDSWGVSSGVGGFSHAATALASHDGKLYNMHRDAAETGTLYWNAVGNPGTDRWPAYTRMAAVSGTTPALASHDGKLYCLHRG
ncbi:hypothetical protein ABZ791_35970 [Streptomyces huasconensis]|uniref:Uncharacterized protein n=1 Tax=Streptomyces huasconensis TaxID=1854574 RepID=A0ABV3M589_9ACTN